LNCHCGRRHKKGRTPTIGVEPRRIKGEPYVTIVGYHHQKLKGASSGGGAEITILVRKNSTPKRT